MINKLRFSLVAVIMLVLLGFGFQDQAKGQVGQDGLFCPGILADTGWIDVTVGTSGSADFTGALLGTVEVSGVDNVGGLDWMHVDETSRRADSPTNETGAQLVGWWTQADGRNSFFQVTNFADDPLSNRSPDEAVEVHVVLFNEDCEHLRDFCDFYTTGDTHVYDFGNLVSNGGQDLGESNLQGHEGFITVTAVFGCPRSSGSAIHYDELAGNMYVLSADDYLYGSNTYARASRCDDSTSPDGEYPGGCQFCDSLGSLATDNPSYVQACDSDFPNSSGIESFACCQNPNWHRLNQEVVIGNITGNILDILDGFLETVKPDMLAGQFNTALDGTAGADAVMINFNDDYGPEGACRSPGGLTRICIHEGPYNNAAATVSNFVGIFDDLEQFQSCGTQSGCFTRLGIDDVVVNSDDFDPATPTPTPTITPTQAPTLGPTSTPRGGSSGSCAIAGNPVQLGTAMANVLIPLVPIAFAFGIRAIRRRKK